jgi:hypothetical protein
MKIFTLKWWFPKKRLSAREMRGPPSGYQSRATAEDERYELARQRAVLRQQQDDEYGNVWAWLRKLFA